MSTLRGRSAKFGVGRGSVGVAFGGLDCLDGAFWALDLEVFDFDWIVGVFVAVLVAFDAAEGGALEGGAFVGVRIINFVADELVLVLVFVFVLVLIALGVPGVSLRVGGAAASLGGWDEEGGPGLRLGLFLGFT